MAVNIVPRAMEGLRKSGNILLLSESFNSMTQRILVELNGSGYKARVLTGLKSKDIKEAIDNENPDLTICPFLKTAIPSEIYETRPCWIVHPGIMGDRGPSSLDWAVKMDKKEWGVTILQAAKEMDHGDIWSSKNFQVPPCSTKSSLYRREVQEHAVIAIKEALRNFQTGNFQPRPLNYQDPDIKGNLLPSMKRKDREVVWTKTAEEIDRIIRSSESSPGAVGTFPSLAGDHQFAIFRSNIEKDGALVKWTKERFTAFFVEKPQPGSILGHSGRAILVATAEEDKALWITHLKPKPGCKYFKNKATKEIPIPEELMVTPSTDLGPMDKSLPRFEIPFGTKPTSFQDVYVWRDPSVNAAYLHLNFLNGAFDSEQCWRAKAAIRQTLRDLKSTKSDHPATLVLMGGCQYFGNGIDLNAVQAAQCPETASWININAINDLIQSFIEEPEVVTVAAVRRNAGAGGVMVAAATDYIISNPSVVLNPSYKGMHLHGSEYWTYFLPRRVGPEVALEWTSSTTPIHALEAYRKGFVDEIVGENFFDCDSAVLGFIPSFVTSPDCRFLSEKKKNRDEAVFRREIAEARSFELEQMRKCFRDPLYHQAREKFVCH